MATPTLTVRPLIPPSEAFTLFLNVSNAFAAPFSLPPSPGTHPNAAAAPWTISPSGPRIPLTTKMRKAAFSVFHTVFHAVLTAARTVLTAPVMVPKLRTIHKTARPTGPVMMPRSSGQFRRTQFHTPMITARTSCQTRCTNAQICRWYLMISTATAMTAAASATHGRALVAAFHSHVAAAATRSDFTNVATAVAAEPIADTTVPIPDFAAPATVRSFPPIVPAVPENADAAASEDTNPSRSRPIQFAVAWAAPMPFFTPPIAVPTPRIAGFSFPAAVVAAYRYRASRSSAVFLLSDARIPDRGSSSCSRLLEFPTPARPAIAFPTFRITVPRFFSTCTASGVSVRNVAMRLWNPVWPDRVVPHTRNFAVILSIPDSRDCDVGRNAFRIPPIPTTTFPIAAAILVIAGPVFFASAPVNDLNPAEDRPVFSWPMMPRSAFLTGARNGFIDARIFGSRPSPLLMTPTTPGAAAVVNAFHLFCVSPSWRARDFTAGDIPANAAFSAFSAATRCAEGVAEAYLACAAAYAVAPLDASVNTVLATAPNTPIPAPAAANPAASPPAATTIPAMAGSRTPEARLTPASASLNLLPPELAASAAAPNPVISPARPAMPPRASCAAFDWRFIAALFRSTAWFAFSTCLVKDANAGPPRSSPRITKRSMFATFRHTPSSRCTASMALRAALRNSRALSAMGRSNHPGLPSWRLRVHPHRLRGPCP